MIPLKQVLDLVGLLDDNEGKDTARDRFRAFLQGNLVKPGDVRDCVEECLRSPGSQYNRALQDIVNHIGRLLGFEVTFGRYQGVVGKIGFDGLWKSPTGLYVVVETKTTDAYSIKTTTLVGYIDGLIAERQVPSWQQALGLYVIGREDSEMKELSNSIVAEKRTEQLRIVSVDKLVSLLELLADYDMKHEAILTLIKPSGPRIDRVVEIIESLVVKELEEATAAEEPCPEKIETASKPISETATLSPHHFLTPVAPKEGLSSIDRVRRLVGQKIYAFRESTPCRKQMKEGDWLAFYATGIGIVAQGRIKASPEKREHPAAPGKEYSFIVNLDNVKEYYDTPVVLDAEMRARLDAFRGKESGKGAWSWFVQSTAKITANDFKVLTGS